MKKKLALLMGAVLAITPACMISAAEDSADAAVILEDAPSGSSSKATESEAEISADASDAYESSDIEATAPSDEVSLIDSIEEYLLEEDLAAAVDEDGESEAESESETDSDTADSLIQLSAPENLAWEDGVATWTAGELTQGVYGVYFYTWDADTETSTFYAGYQLDVSEDALDDDGIIRCYGLSINEPEPDTYFFVVMAFGDDITYSDSEYVSSAVWVYETPDDQLATPTDVTWVTTDESEEAASASLEDHHWKTYLETFEGPAALTWNYTGDATHLYAFDVAFYVSDTEDGAEQTYVMDYILYLEDLSQTGPSYQATLDLADFTTGGDGYYFAYVRAISDNIGLCAGSEWAVSAPCQLVYKDGLVLDSEGVFRYYQDCVFAEDYIGLISYGGSQFFISGGLINTSINGLCLYEDVWYFVAYGQVQTGYTGLALYDDAWFFITNGVLDTSKCGLVPYDGETFLVADGQLLLSYSGLWLNSVTIGGDDLWYFIGAGMVQNVSQVVMYDGAFFVVEDGILNTDYNGTIEYDGSTFTVVNGQLY